MEQQVEVAVDSAGRLIISAPGVTFKLVPAAEPPPVDPPPVDPPPVDPPPPPPVSVSDYVWVDVATLPGKPRSGRGWNNMYSMAKGNAPGPVSVADQNSMHSAWMQACAYTYAATGDTAFLAKVITGFKSLVSPSLSIGRALALAREVQGYVAAAEGIQLAKVDADLDAVVKAKFRYFLTCPTTGGGPATLTKSHLDRANNWGTHATAAVLMIARYIGDKTVFDNAIKVFRGFLGDRSSYAGFKFDQPGWEEWQSDSKNPVGINPKNAQIQGHNVDGALPEELRRGGGFEWPLPPTPPTYYPWEAEQGITVSVAVALNAGVDLRPASDWAHLRSIKWLYDVAHWPIVKDDAWQAPVLNWLYPELKLGIPDGGPGKGMAWTEFTHQ